MRKVTFQETLLLFAVAFLAALAIVTAAYAVVMIITHPEDATKYLS